MLWTPSQLEKQRLEEERGKTPDTFLTGVVVRIKEYLTGIMMVNIYLGMCVYKA